MTGKYYQIKHKERYVYDIFTNKGLGKKTYKHHQY